MLSGIKNFEHVNSCARHLKLMTALGAELPVLGHIRSSIRIGEIEIATHVTLQTLVQVRQATVGPCLITPLLETPVDAVDECAVPDFLKTSCVKLPECAGSEFSAFRNSIGPVPNKARCNRGHMSLYYSHRKSSQSAIQMHPAQYQEEVQKQLEEMLDQGIIEESSSLWMAPAVYVRKKSGKLRMCVDHRELTSRQQRMHIHYHCQMKSRISWRNP